MPAENFSTLTVTFRFWVPILAIALLTTSRTGSAAAGGADVAVAPGV